MSFSLKQFYELINFRVTDSSEYHDKDLGDHLIATDYWNGLHDHGGVSLECVHDAKTLEVVQLEVHDYTRELSYRWNPERLRKPNRDKTAYDEVEFVDLDVLEDWVEKAQAIIAGRDYDTRVVVPLDISDEDFLLIAKAAHKLDVTFNKFVEDALKSAVEAQLKL